MVFVFTDNHRHQSYRWFCGKGQNLRFLGRDWRLGDSYEQQYRGVQCPLVQGCKWNKICSCFRPGSDFWEDKHNYPWTRFCSVLHPSLGWQVFHPLCCVMRKFHPLAVAYFIVRAQIAFQASIFHVSEYHQWQIFAVNWTKLCFYFQSYFWNQTWNVAYGHDIFVLQFAHKKSFVKNSFLEGYIIRVPFTFL